MHHDDVTPDPQHTDDRRTERWEPPSFEVISGAEILAGGDTAPDLTGMGNS